VEDIKLHTLFCHHFRTLVNVENTLCFMTFQASGGALSPAIAAFQQVPVVPTMPAQLEPTAPGWFFQAEAFDSSSCNGHSDSCAVLFDDSAYIR